MLPLIIIGAGLALVVIVVLLSREKHSDLLIPISVGLMAGLCSFFAFVVLFGLPDSESLLVKALSVLCFLTMAVGNPLVLFCIVRALDRIGLLLPEEFIIPSFFVSGFIWFLVTLGVRAWWRKGRRANQAPAPGVAHL
jgi:hypothetical protein